MVFKQDDLGCGTVSGHVLAQGGANAAGEFQTRVDVWNNSEMASADDDGIREDVFQKWSRSVSGRQNGKHRLRMAVTNPFCSAFGEADSVHEGFYRWELGGRIHARGLENSAHTGVGQRRIIKCREGCFHANAGEAIFVKRGEAGTGGFHKKCAIAEICAGIAFAEDRQAPLFLANFA